MTERPWTSTHSTSPADRRPAANDGSHPRPGDLELLQRVRGRLVDAVTHRTSVLHQTVRADEGCWQSIGPGVERKVLWETTDTLSCLMRLAPGALVAGHAHPLDEECVVLEGSLRIGDDLVLHAGDFHVGVRGVRHEAAHTDTGAVVYLRSARDPA
jgi:quercetin dioxygenase-like cupin family protein